MSEMRNAAYVQAMASCAVVEALGMLAENMARGQRGESPAYGEEQFQCLIERYGIHHNAVVALMRGE